MVVPRAGGVRQRLVDGDLTQVRAFSDPLPPWPACPTTAVRRSRRGLLRCSRARARQSHTLRCAASWSSRSPPPSSATPSRRRHLNDLRLRRAALLLTHTNRDILIIAGDLGFANLTWFYRLFRRRYTTTPLAYRRTHSPATWRTPG